MNEKSVSSESEISRAIDEVLAAEKDVGKAVEAATAAADSIRREATESSHRILATANRRIGAIHRKIAADIQEEVTRLRDADGTNTDQQSAIELDDEQLDQLAAAAAEWLTTDAHH